MNKPRHNVLITGAGSGIGLATADCFLARRCRVCAIDVKFTNTTAGDGNRREIVADINDTSLVDQIISSSDAEPFDTVIHCAGISAVGRFEKIDADAIQSVIDTNLRAPMRITRDLLKSGATKKDATHVFVASLSCFTGYPGASVYAATKDGLHAYARSLRAQLAKAGGRVVTVFPGPTDTPHATHYSPGESDSDSRMSPERVAAKIYAALGRGQFSVVPGVTISLFAMIARLVPGLATRLMGNWLLPKLDADNLVLTAADSQHSK